MCDRAANGAPHTFWFDSREPAREKQEFLSKLRTFAERSGWSAAITNEVELIVEEWWTNILAYAIPDRRDPIVTVSVEANSETITLRIEDNGIPFDPLSRPEPDLSLPIDQRPIGGLGIYMIRKLSRRLRSERRNDRNVLVIEKDLRTPVLGSGKEKA